MYSGDFLETLEDSHFFTMCKNNVEGKFQWTDWSDCSVSCGGGLQIKNSTCVPEYVKCFGIPTLERSCRNQVCPTEIWICNDWNNCTV